MQTYHVEMLVGGNWTEIDLIRASCHTEALSMARENTPYARFLRVRTDGSYTYYTGE